MGPKILLAFLSTVIGFLAVESAATVSPVPACRLDDSMAGEVRETVERATATYQALGKLLPFSRVEVNPKTDTISSGILIVWVLRNASRDAVDAHGCSNRPADKDKELDDLSVRGGCYVASAGKPEMRCSADAVKLFADRGNGSLQPNPALLYVLAHELAHILQKRAGEYSGRAVPLTASQDQATRLQMLRDNCDPVSTKREERADELAFSVLAKGLPAPPYKEPALSERGSLLWNIDRLALASDAWQREGSMLETMSAPKVHEAFEPTEFPMPPKKIRTSARRFVCDVLQSKGKAVSFPARSSTHPPVEVRLRNIVEVLKPIAQQLPSIGGARGYEPVARLQQDLGDIFSHMYRETGVYTEALHESICSIVNAENPVKVCGKGR